eukprot:7378137-Prymnesium_polylepis.1
MNSRRRSSVIRLCTCPGNSSAGTHGTRPVTSRNGSIHVSIVRTRGRSHASAHRKRAVRSRSAANAPPQAPAPHENSIPRGPSICSRPANSSTSLTASGPRRARRAGRAAAGAVVVPTAGRVAAGAVVVPTAGRAIAGAVAVPTAVPVGGGERAAGLCAWNGGTAQRHGAGALATQGGGAANSLRGH